MSLAFAPLRRVPQSILPSHIPRVTSWKALFGEARYTRECPSSPPQRGWSLLLRRGQANASGGSPHQDHKVSIKSSKQPNANGKADYLHSVRSSSPPGSVEPSIARHPKSYMEHWEVNQAQNSSSQVLQSQTNGEAFNFNGATTYQLNGDSSVPWWQQKNSRIAEIENEVKTASYGTLSNEQPVQHRRWVPPQPPPVAMAEAAEAIRRPKPLFQKEQSADDQSVSQPSDVSDELQRITKVSESGGAVEINGGRSGLNPSEILEEKEQNY